MSLLCTIFGHKFKMRPTGMVLHPCNSNDEFSVMRVGQTCWCGLTETHEVKFFDRIGEFANGLYQENCRQKKEIYNLKIAVKSLVAGSDNVPPEILKTIEPLL